VPGARRANITARTWGIPAPATSSAIDYFDTLRQSSLPANLIQAQRDYFGAHTYERLDREGIFHTVWQDEPERIEVLEP
jgi:6-phosphogluconate dehydrogenase